MREVFVRQHDATDCAAACLAIKGHKVVLVGFKRERKAHDCQAASKMLLNR